MKNKKITSLVSAIALMATMLVPVSVSYAAETTMTVDDSNSGGNFDIASAYISDGKNTVVKTYGIASGVVIAVKYDGKKISALKTAPINASATLSNTETTVVEGIGADKVMVWNSLKDMKPLCPAAAVTQIEPTTEPTAAPIPAQTLNVDFTALSAVPVYSAENGQGFVEKSDAIMPDANKRQVAPTSQITVSGEGAKVTESNGSYLYTKSNSNDGDDFNHGGLIYRLDTAPGAYHIEVEVTGSSSDTWVAPTGMQASRITAAGSWDTGGHVPHTVSAKWEGSKWSYDFATGESFVEIEIEPTSKATESATKTVGVKSIKITPLDVNPAGEKPTIHIMGDSTQKTYTFNETISAWGQTLVNYFDPEKVNVINYSMGGRAMKSNYNEGRFDEILINGKAGDFVFIHSAHNDETISTNRYSRGAGSVANDLDANNENYNKWLDMYVSAIKARGMTPVLVTSMPRTSSGKTSTSTTKPNGFNPDSPGNMRAKAAADDGVGLVELYAGAVEYISKLDAKEVMYIYNNFEAGETPANSSANGTNGDGTHYREAASKMWNRIMLQSIYDQSVASADTYTDKSIMAELVKLMPENVKAAAQSGDWSAVFPEMASDVSAVDVVPSAQKQSEADYYYRNNIEKALQAGLLHKDTSNLFKPTQTITVGEFARGVEKAFGLDENSLTSYTKTYAELQGAAEANAASDGGTVMADGDVYAAADDEAVTVTVTQSEGGIVTVYNNSAFNTYTVDIPAGVTASQIISDNDYFKLTAPTEIVTKSDSNGAMADGITKNAIEVRNNGTKQPEYVAKADGILTLYLMFVDHKLITCENKTTGEKATKYINNTTVAGDTQANQYAAVTFNVLSGNTYEVYTNGGTGRLFGVKYESNDYPHSTESLSANSGDEIRVVATPAENHVNGKIIINGEEKSTSKEYVFNVSGDTTVTATFKSEPALVETTKVASDAALTREVMGAILYDAYKAAETKYSGVSGGIWANVSKYLSQTGSVPSPSDPSYDPNIKYESATYYPLTGWGALSDTDALNAALYGKVKAAYNLGLIRTETGIARSTIANGIELEPKAEVTRAKAAKALVFCWILTQDPKGENQTVNGGNGVCEASLNKAAVNAADIAAPNADAPSTVFTD